MATHTYIWFCFRFVRLNTYSGCLEKENIRKNRRNQYNLDKRCGLVNQTWIPTLKNNWANPGMDSYADTGGGEPPPTPTSPVCDSAYSEHHGCWPCEHRDHSDCDVTHPSQPSSGRGSPRWEEDEEEERHHHILTQGLGSSMCCRRFTPANSPRQSCGGSSASKVLLAASATCP